MQILKANNQYRICPSCGNFSHMNEGQFYCILCGTKCIDRCEKCESPIIHPYGKYCYNCGHKYGITVRNIAQGE